MEIMYCSWCLLYSGMVSSGMLQQESFAIKSRAFQRVHNSYMKVALDHL